MYNYTRVISNVSYHKRLNIFVCRHNINNLYKRSKISFNSGMHILQMYTKQWLGGRKRTSAYNDNKTQFETIHYSLQSLNFQTISYTFERNKRVGHRQEVQREHKSIEDHPTIHCSLQIHHILSLWKNIQTWILLETEIPHTWRQFQKKNRKTTRIDNSTHRTQLNYETA